MEHKQKRFPCLYEGCSKRFKTKIGRNNHFRDVHESDDSSTDEEFDYDPPYFHMEGNWVSREEFLNIKGQSKSFGKFFCDCGNYWQSAHTHGKYKQACESCDEYKYPSCMWINNNNNYCRNNGNEDDKPHKSKLCEACKRGVCIAR